MFIIDIMMAISNWLWGWPLLILTSAVAVYLSVRFKFFQFTRFGHAMKNTFGKIFDKGDGEGDISPFQACCTALASTLGVGNIAGVCDRQHLYSGKVRQQHPARLCDDF